MGGQSIAVDKIEQPPVAFRQKWLGSSHGHTSPDFVANADAGRSVRRAGPILADDRGVEAEAASPARC